MVRKKRDELGRIGVSLPKPLLTFFDDIIKEQGYSQRSEALRELIRGHIEKYVSREAKGNEIGVWER